MEQNKQSLDLRTLLLLMVEHEEMPWDTVMDLIAEEVNIPADQLKTVITNKSRGSGRNRMSFSEPSSAAVQPTPKPSPKDGANKKRTYSRWGDDRLDELVNRWNDGQKPGEIAREMGVSTQTVYQKISRLRKTRNDVQARTSRNPAFSGSGGKNKNN